MSERKVTSEGLDKISDYIYEMKGVRVKVLPPTSARQSMLYFHALGYAKNYFKNKNT